MFLASLLSLFTSPKAYVWQPAVNPENPELVSTLLPDCIR